MRITMHSRTTRSATTSSMARGPSLGCPSSCRLPCSAGLSTSAIVGLASAVPYPGNHVVRYVFQIRQRYGGGATGHEMDIWRGLPEEPGPPRGAAGRLPGAAALAAELVQLILPKVVLDLRPVD